ncbi:MAG: hypothetical protein ABIG84_04245 [archaeon]
MMHCRNFPYVPRSAQTARDAGAESSAFCRGPWGGFLRGAALRS